MDVSEMDGMLKLGDTVKHASVSTTTSRVKLSKRVKARNRKMLSCPCHLQYNCSLKPSGFSSITRSDEGVILSSIPSHAVFVFLDPLLLGVIEVEYQNKPRSPIETHPVNIWIFLMAICFYSAVLGVKKSTHSHSHNGRNYDRILNSILLVLGALSSASLLSILLPHTLVWFLIIIWASLPMILARHLLKLLFSWISGRIVDSVSQAGRNFNGMNQSDQQHLPK